MKVIYLHQYFNTPNMAGGTRSYEMARRLVSVGHEVHMVTTWREPTDKQGWFTTKEAGIHVHWLPVLYSNDMSYMERIRAFILFACLATQKAASLPGDIVFATSTPLTISIPGILSSWWKRIPMVFEVRDMWPDVPIALGVLRNPILVWLSRWLEIFTYRKAAHVIALAPGMRKDIIGKGIQAEKVSVIPNGCDLDVFFAEAKYSSPRREYAWLGKRKLVIYAGTVGKANGVDYLVQLAREVFTIDPEIRFVILGDGREWDAVYQLAGKAGIINRNLFMFTSLPKRKIVRWLMEADIHVALMRGPRSYLKDAVNNKFFDALAAGKPIANNFNGWQSRVAEEAGVGLILDPVDIAAAARRLVDALSDEDWLSKVLIRTRELSEGCFNRDRLALQLEDVLTTVVMKGN